jgi:ClpX C4-type zinc finger
VVAVTAVKATIAVCSFCLRPNTEVATLVAGPGVFICDECVQLCGEVIAQKSGPGPVAQVAPWESATDLDKILVSMPKIAAAGAQVEANVLAWVRRARALGATWARVGEALGMTRQSAWERFSGEE